MADLSTLSALSNDSNLTNGQTIENTEHNTHRTNYRALINNLLTTARDLEKNYASSTAPGDKPIGKLFSDTTDTDKAILKFYRDSSSNTASAQMDYGSHSMTPSTAGAHISIGASTITDDNTAASGTASAWYINAVGTPTLAASNASVTVTNAATWYIAAAPAAGTNMTLTNAYALWVDSGTTRLDGTVQGPSGSWDSGGIDIAASDTYAIDGTNVLSATTLGSGVVNSSLTSVGALETGSIVSGFGNIDIAGNDLTATGTVILGGTSFQDNNITNVGDIALDSISADGSNILLNNDTQMVNSGSTGPSFQLNATGTSGKKWNIYSHGLAASLGPAGAFIVRDATVGSTRLVLTNTYSGVGTLAPAGEWHVENGDATGPSFVLKSQTRQWNTYSSGGSSALGPANGYMIRDSTLGATRFTIDTSGIVAMSAVYGHDMNGETIRDLQINNSGELGYDSSTRRVKTSLTPMGDTSWLYEIPRYWGQYKKKKKIKDKNGMVIDEVYIDEGTGIDEPFFIAEEVEKVNSTFVFYNEIEDEKGNITKQVEGVHYKKFVVPMLNELTKHERQIKDLIEKVNVLSLV
jgi:hypothetical protein